MIDVAALLGQPPAVVDDAGIAAMLAEGPVLVTGAGGSIGSELCRQIASRGGRLILVERFESNLFEIHRAVGGAARLVDVRDRARMAKVFAADRPSIVLHAAAHKHVALLEDNLDEAIANNVGGTKVVADLAREHGIARLMLISTDKAVAPISVMGATKAIAEQYVRALGYSAVRFGNVLGSSGSVVPLFLEQLARGPRITLTDPRMTRYFISAPDACKLTLQATLLARGGEVFVVDMGAPVKVTDLALALGRAVRPGEEITFDVIGARPGEKLDEQLADEPLEATAHPRIGASRIAAK